MLAWEYGKILRGIYLTTCVILLGSCNISDTSNGSNGSDAGDAGDRDSPKLPDLDFSCNSDSDCCVVTDACMTELWLVAKKQMSEMQSYVSWREQDERKIGCSACIPPSVQVSCENGQCKGTVVYDDPQMNDLMETHCGRLSVTDSAGVSPSKQMLVANTGMSESPDIQKTVFGCGD